MIAATLRAQLVAEWRWLLRNSWCLRFTIAAATLSAGEIALPLLAGDVIPPLLCAGLSFVCSVSAYFARIIAQKRESNG